MSDQHHESLIKTPKQLIVTVIAAFLVPIAIIVLLTVYVTSGRKTGAGSDGTTEQATDARIAPVAHFEIVDANAPRAFKSGKEVYEAVCTTCHQNGIAGAPKFGDATAWAPRIAQGATTLYDHAINGYHGKAGQMPAKGGNPDLADVEVQRAVVYMADAGGAKFPEPPTPAPTAAAAEPSAPAAPQADPAVVATIAAIDGGGKAPVSAPASTSAAAASPVVASAGNEAGKKLFESVCTACHGMGIAGSPKFGDKAAWAPRIAKGLDTLYDHAIHGFQGNAGVMPPKGGSSASDDDVKAAVRYMVDAAK